MSPLELKFRREVRKAYLLNPMRGFELEEQVLERRFDPLTGFSTFIARERLQYIEKYFKTDKRLLEELAELTRPTCPFCPERVGSLTSRFPENVIREGRVKIGECIAFPSLHAHADFNAVVVLGSKHLVYPKELGADTLAEGFQAGFEVLKAAYEAYPELSYGSIIMNYLPPAGSSIIHPHMQTLSSNTPFNHQRLLLSKSYEYYVQTSRNYWADLINYEKEAKERFIAEGKHMVWLAPFAPLRFLEVWGLFKEPFAPLDIGTNQIKELAYGLSRILAFYEDRDIICINLALLLPSFKDHQGYFNPQIRVCARFGLSRPFLNDFWALAALLLESEVVEFPEDYAVEIKKYFL